MTDDDRKPLLILTAARYAATCIGSVALRDPLFFSLWAAVFILGGGMMLLVIVLRIFSDL